MQLKTEVSLHRGSQPRWSSCAGLGVSSLAHVSCVAMSAPLDAQARCCHCSHRLCAHRLHHGMGCVATLAVVVKHQLIMNVELALTDGV